MTIRRSFPLALLLVPAFLSAQVLRVASYNVAGLGEQRKDYAALAKVINNFDVVAAEEVMNAGGLEKVLSLLADGWEGAISKHSGFFGFFYNERVELYKMLGEYPKRAVFPPAMRSELQGERLPIFVQSRCVSHRFGAGRRGSKRRDRPVWATCIVISRSSPAIMA